MACCRFFGVLLCVRTDSQRCFLQSAREAGRGIRKHGGSEPDFLYPGPKALPEQFHHGCLESVSYTHLDVYKRQVHIGAVLGGLEGVGPEELIVVHKVKGEGGQALSLLFQFLCADGRYQAGIHAPREEGTDGHI